MGEILYGKNQYDIQSAMILGIANLLIEYIGYECFPKVVKVTNPQYVLCIFQINMEFLEKYHNLL